MKFSIYFLFINFLIIKIAFADSNCNLGGIDSCQNGGSCSNQDDENDDDHNVQTGTCKCKAGYTGSTCATYVGGCLINKCKNGGSCSSTTGICTCMIGFIGDSCESYSTITSSRKITTSISTLSTNSKVVASSTISTTVSTPITSKTVASLTTPTTIITSTSVNFSTTTNSDTSCSQISCTVPVSLTCFLFGVVATSFIVYMTQKSKMSQIKPNVDTPSNSNSLSNANSSKYDAPETKDAQELENFYSTIKDTQTITINLNDDEFQYPVLPAPN